MVRLELMADDGLFAALQDAAQQRSMSVEDFARAALQEAVAQIQAAARQYSFIGIGRSGDGQLSQRVEDGLKQADRREGWSLP